MIERFAKPMSEAPVDGTAVIVLLRHRKPGSSRSKAVRWSPLYTAWELLDGKHPEVFMAEDSFVGWLDCETLLNAALED